MTFGDATSDSLNMNLFKKILKIILAVIVGIFILDVGLWAGSRMMKGYLMWKGERLVSQFKADSERPLREDVYGGKTPEETFDMYLAALKKGDLELASKYFVVERQGEHLDRLNKRSSDGNLSLYIQNLQQMRDHWKLGTRELFDYQREYVYGDGDKILSATFSLSSYTKVWKIDFL